MPVAPMYRSPYGGSIMDLLSRQGDAQAQAALMKGRIWGDAVQNIGQIGAQAYQQHAEQKEMGKRDMALSAFVESGSWMQDPQAAIAGSVKILGPRAGVQFAEGLIGAAKMMQGDPLEASKALPMVARGFAAAPAALKPTLYGNMKGILEKAQLIQPGQLPETYSPDLDAMIASYAGDQKTETGFSLSAGQTRFDATGKPIASVAAPVEPPKVDSRSLDARYAEAVATGNTAEAQKLLQAKARLEAAGRAPDKGTEDKQKEVEAWVSAIAAGDYTVDKVPPTIKSAVMVAAQNRGLDTRTLAQRDLDAGAEQTIESLKQLREQATKTMTADTGPGAKFQGVAQGALNYVGLAPETRKWEMQQAKLSMLARQMGEKGVLTDRDVDRVIGMLPKLTDPDHIRDRALNDIEEVIFTGLRGKVSNRVKVPGGAEAAAPGGVVEWEKGPDGKPRRKQGA